MRSGSHLFSRAHVVRDPKETRIKISKANKGSKNGMYGKIISEETRLKLSIINKGRKRSEEIKKQMSKSKLGKNNPNFGKIYTFEEKEKQRLSHTGEKNYMYGKTHSLKAKEKIGYVSSKLYNLIYIKSKLKKQIKNLTKFCKINKYKISWSTRIDPDIIAISESGSKFHLIKADSWM